jgi:adenylate cyclase
MAPMLPRNPLGSWLFGSGTEGGRRLRWRVTLLLTTLLVLANGIGSALVTALLFFVIPGDEVLTQELAWVNFVWGPTYSVIALVVGGFWGIRMMRRTLQWSRENRPATRQERIATLRIPWMLTGLSGLLWAVGTVVMTALYTRENPDLLWKTGITTTFAGIVVCANTYLMTEFALRPVSARALASSPPRRPTGVGITMRALLIGAWGALPVAGLMIIGLFQLVSHNISADELALSVVALCGVALVVGLVLTWFNTRAMVAPIRSVTDAMRRVQHGHLDTEVVVFDGTELGLLQTGFNRMIHDVRERQRVRDLFGRHVGEDVAKAALERDLAMGGEVRDVAVLFIDLVGSTVLASERPPTEVVELLNRFFAVVVAEVHAHEGFVNKFEGDAALAIFGAPEDHPDAAGRALAAARRMAERLNTEVPDALAGIGVSAGPVVAGNVGAEDRFEYTVIGDPVNEAARLTEEAKQVPGRVVASLRAVTAASPEEAAHWTALHEVSLRGRATSTMLAVPK